MLTDVRPGARYRSAVDETEVIVIRAPLDELDLRCGGQPLAVIDDQVRTGSLPAPGFDGGTLIGKRYVDETGQLEILCTKGGTGTLSLGDAPLKVKAAKPLPSSD